VLTQRQSDVMSLKSVGKTNKEIATELGVNESTVQEHVQSVVKKLGALNATHCIALFARQKLADRLRGSGLEETLRAFIKEQTGQDSLNDITFDDGLTEVINYINKMLKQLENVIEYSSETLSPEKLCRSRFPVITSLHDYLFQNASIIDTDFAEYFPHLTICKPTSSFDLAPPILMMGQKCDQRQLFEFHFGNDAFASGRTPDHELERLAAYGYEYAFENGIFCEQCEALVRFPTGEKLVPFVRYIARYHVPGGHTLIAYAASLLNRTLQ